MFTVLLLLFGVPAFYSAWGSVGREAQCRPARAIMSKRGFLAMFLQPKVTTLPTPLQRITMADFHPTRAGDFVPSYEPLSLSLIAPFTSYGSSQSYLDHAVDLLPSPGSTKTITPLISAGRAAIGLLRNNYSSTDCVGPPQDRSSIGPAVLVPLS